MRCARFALLATLVIAAPSVRAQTSVPLDSRVRVTLRDDSRVRGRLVDVRGDTLLVKRDGLLHRPTVRLPANRTKRVEVARGKQLTAGRMLGAMVLGAGGGLVAGFVIEGNGCSADVCSGPQVLPHVIIGAMAGGLTAVVYPGDRWERVPTPVRVGVDPGLRRGVFAVSFAF